MSEHEEFISVKQHEREVRRWFCAFMVVLVMFVAAVAGWIISEKKHYSDDFGFEYMWLVPEEEPGADEVAFG